MLFAWEMLQPVGSYAHRVSARTSPVHGWRCIAAIRSCAILLGGQGTGAERSSSREFVGGIEALKYVLSRRDWELYLSLVSS